MVYRNSNYCAFYVDEPFNQNNLGASSIPDFVTYNLLRAWKVWGLYLFLKNRRLHKEVSNVAFFR